MRFLVCGVDDSGLTELQDYDLQSEAIRFVKSYTSRLDDDGRAGGWSLIEVYDREFAEDLGECVCYRWEAAAQ